MSKVVITLQIPEGVQVDVDYQQDDQPPFEEVVKPVVAAPKYEDTNPVCEHGPRYFKEGTNKSGKPYAGYFCKADSCAPVWSKAR